MEQTKEKVDDKTEEGIKQHPKSEDKEQEIPVIQIQIQTPIGAGIDREVI
jgi:hypothetical protein